MKQRGPFSSPMKSDPMIPFKDVDSGEVFGFGPYYYLKINKEKSVLLYGTVYSTDMPLVDVDMEEFVRVFPDATLDFTPEEKE